MRYPTVVLLALCVVSFSNIAAGTDVNHYVRQGDRYFQAGDYGRAAAQFAEAANRYHTAPIPRLALGHAFFAMGRFAEASRSLQDGIHLSPSWSQSGIDLRGFFSDPAVFDSALDDLARAILKRPKDRELLFLLAYCRYFSGHPLQARKMFRQLLDMAPDHEAARTFVDPDSARCPPSASHFRDPWPKGHAAD